MDMPLLQTTIGSIQKNQVGFRFLGLWGAVNAHESHTTVRCKRHKPKPTTTHKI
jgi:hypothetical protein